MGPPYSLAFSEFRPSRKNEWRNKETPFEAGVRN